jgi:hypothetical protein
VAFDVHLPNQLDPTFSIRDYGTGLSHEQVVNIYTTYFESTKTESNAFIGALGLGSKSPFSYTDNFTVTAIKDGVRGVYSAFINGEGVPSIALMHSEASDQAPGVEVKFAVENRSDMYKFEEEAMFVYTHFRLRPNVTGADNFKFRDVEYEDRNVIPGVHVLKQDRYNRSSKAVMGNIAYPIEVPNAETTLFSLSKLLDCGLEMHFDIGELDFQASREGLSYIPSTIRSIRSKLEALNAQLAVHLTLEADAIVPLWERAQFLRDKHQHSLWSEAVVSYLTTSQFPLLENRNGYLRTHEFKFDVKDLANRFNIVAQEFTKSRGGAVCQDVKPTKEYLNDGYTEFNEFVVVPADNNVFFVTNDLKTGALTRAKYHWRHSKDLPDTRGHSHTVYVLTPAVKGKKMDTMGLFAELMNPPRCGLASQLMEKDRKDATARAKDVRILKLALRERGYNSEATWTEAGRANEYDTTSTFYYVPLSGWSPVNEKLDVKVTWNHMRHSGIGGLTDIAIYGVRKSDIEFIKTQKNWIDLEQHLASVLGKLTTTQLHNLAMNEFDGNDVLRYNNVIEHNVAPNSPYVALVKKFKGLHKIRYNVSSLNRLLDTYAPGVSLAVTVDAIRAEIAQVCERYPLLACIRNIESNAQAVAEYINLIDNQKGIQSWRIHTSSKARTSLSSLTTTHTRSLPAILAMRRLRKLSRTTIGTQCMMLLSPRRSCSITVQAMSASKARNCFGRATNCTPHWPCV